MSLFKPRERCARRWWYHGPYRGPTPVSCAGRREPHHIRKQTPGFAAPSRYSLLCANRLCSAEPEGLARSMWGELRTLNSARNDCPSGSRKVLHMCALLDGMNFMGRDHATQKVSSRHLLALGLVPRVAGTHGAASSMHWCGVAMRPTFLVAA